MERLLYGCPARSTPREICAQKGLWLFDSPGPDDCIAAERSTWAREEPRTTSSRFLVIRSDQVTQTGSPPSAIRKLIDCESHRRTAHASGC